MTEPQTIADLFGNLCQCCRKHHGETVYVKPWHRPARLCIDCHAAMHDAMVRSPQWAQYRLASMACQAVQGSMMGSGYLAPLPTSVEQAAEALLTAETDLDARVADWLAAHVRKEKPQP